MQHNLPTVERAAQEGGGPLADVLVKCHETVAADMPSVGDVAVDGIGRGRRGQAHEKGRIEHRDVRDIGQQSACHLDAQYRRRVVQRGQRRQLAFC